MVDASAFAKLVPGFDFLQGLVKNAGAAVPGIGQWVAPTLNPEELEKRISELRTVQYWLEQNVRMLGATIQALEVQRMTLSTLKTMNVQMNDLRDALTIPLPTLGAAPDAEDAAAAPPKAAPKPAPATRPELGPTAAAAAAAAAAPAPLAHAAAIDPMQWWGALTKQFTELATAAMKDGASGAARNLAGASGAARNLAGAVLQPAAASPKKARKASAARPATATRRAAPAKRKPAA